MSLPTASRKISPLQRLGLDLGPLLIFFLAFQWGGIFVATGMFMVTILVALGIGYGLERRLSPMPLFTAVLVLIFGGLTLYLKDESSHPTGSLKHRLARSLFLYALCNDWIGPKTTVIEASSGSTAVSEAYFARLLGLRFIAVVPASTAPPKLDAIRFYGGEIYEVADPRTVGDRLPGRVEAPVRDRNPVDHRAGRARRGQHRRVEAREPVLEVDGDAEPVDVAGQLDRLCLERRPAFWVAGQEPRRDRLDVDHVTREVEHVEPDHPGTAVVTILVVGDVHVHVVVGGVCQDRTPGRPVVAVQREEDLVVVADQPVP